MSGEFADRVIVVSGGARGIGRATVELLAGENATVVIADANIDAGSIVAKGLGSSVVVEEVDLRSVQSIGAVVERTVDRFGRVDGLANVAAVYPSASFVETTPEMFDLIAEVNLRGSFFFAQHVARAMIRTHTAGAIVNVASGAAHRPVRSQAAYSASKGGVVAMSRTMAQELAEHQIRVNVVSPGHTKSETVLAQTSVEQLDALGESLFGGRWMEPQEVAAAIVFLLSDAARAMTGATLNVNLGDYMPH
jgi:NAD(P)-dependent dehydrogenase (short-subunit alcohol dehydrogenase family)